MNEDHPRPASESMALLRILDANYNRASEGLRVIEEYARFVLEAASLAKQLKLLRHDLSNAFAAVSNLDRLAARDTPNDVGTGIQVAGEYARPDITAVVLANTKRVEQSLRCLEEFGKVLNPELGRQVEQLRYRAYHTARLLGLAIERPALFAQAQLYVLLDGCADLDTFALKAEAVVAGGADIVQLRDKQLLDRELLARARALRRITYGRALLIINDRPDIAVLCDADGVHVGQDELSVKEARTILGPRRLVGVSTHSLEQARQAVLDGADYIGCGPTFASGTKSFSQFPGLAFLREVAADICVPAFAIGGISIANVGQVMAAGLYRIAVSGAAMTAEHPGEVVKALKAKLPPLTSSPPAIS